MAKFASPEVFFALQLYVPGSRYLGTAFPLNQVLPVRTVPRRRTILVEGRADELAYPTRVLVFETDRSVKDLGFLTLFFWIDPLPLDFYPCRHTPPHKGRSNVIFESQHSDRTVLLRSRPLIDLPVLRIDLGLPSSLSPFGEVLSCDFFFGV